MTPATDSLLTPPLFEALEPPHGRCEIHFFLSQGYCDKRARWHYQQGDALLCGEHRREVEWQVAANHD